jgi:hypothetical protein
MKFLIACVLTSVNASRETLTWFWKAMGVWENEALEQNDRIMRVRLLRSPSELQLAAASPSGRCCMCYLILRLSSNCGKFFQTLLVLSLAIIRAAPFPLTLASSRVLIVPFLSFTQAHILEIQTSSGSKGFIDCSRALVQVLKLLSGGFFRIE